MHRYLTIDYPHDLGYYPTIPLEFPEQSFNGAFSLSDEKACNDCPLKSTCDQKMLLIDTSTPLKVLAFEQFVKQFDDTSAAIKERCDYLVYDEIENKSRIAFCELTCSSEQYVEPNDGCYPEGKRARAYRQIESTIESLLRNILLTAEIMTYPSRLGIFGWREKRQTPTDHAMIAMEDFITTPSSEEKVLISLLTIMSHQFSFVQVRYPGQFDWNNSIN